MQLLRNQALTVSESTAQPSSQPLQQPDRDRNLSDAGVHSAQDDPTKNGGPEDHNPEDLTEELTNLTLDQDSQQPKGSRDQRVCGRLSQEECGSSVTGYASDSAASSTSQSLSPSSEEQYGGTHQSDTNVSSSNRPDLEEAISKPWHIRHRSRKSSSLAVF